MKKKLFVLPILVALCTVALPAFAKNQKEQMRFRGLDRNKDGRITRNEWRGNDQSFANEDWNGDGILSGVEVRPGARRPNDLLSSERNEASFRDQDHNNNGFIARNEWDGDRQAFDRMDANRDGVLSRDEYFVRGHDRESRFSDLDTNRDNKIGRDEWRSDRRAFDRLDVNRNGALSRDEFSARGDDSNDDGIITRTEWRGDSREFDGVDANRDGVLSRDEFLWIGDGRARNEWRGDPIIIASGTEFPVRSSETIDSKTASVGQHFLALIERDILDSTGALAIPKGSDAELVIRQTEGGSVTTASELVLDVDSVTVAGRRYLVSTEDLGEKGRQGIGANRRTGVMVGGGAGLGALIGAIAGGGKGAAIGAGVGAAAGAAGQILTKGNEVRVPAETVLNFRLEQDLRLEPAS